METIPEEGELPVEPKESEWTKEERQLTEYACNVANFIVRLKKIIAGPVDTTVLAELRRSLASFPTEMIPNLFLNAHIRTVTQAQREAVSGLVLYLKQHGINIVSTPKSALAVDTFLHKLSQLGFLASYGHLKHGSQLSTQQPQGESEPAELPETISKSPEGKSQAEDDSKSRIVEERKKKKKKAKKKAYEARQKARRAEASLSVNEQAQEQTVSAEQAKEGGTEGGKGKKKAGEIVVSVASEGSEMGRATDTSDSASASTGQDRPADNMLEVKSDAETWTKTFFPLLSYIFQAQEGLDELAMKELRTHGGAKTELYEEITRIRVHIRSATNCFSRKGCLTSQPAATRQDEHSTGRARIATARVIAQGQGRLVSNRTRGRARDQQERV